MASVVDATFFVWPVSVLCSCRVVFKLSVHCRS